MQSCKHLVDPEYKELVPPGLQQLFWNLNGKRVVNAMHMHPNNPSAMVHEILMVVRQTWHVRETRS